MSRIRRIGEKRLNIAEDGPKIGQRSPKIAQDEPKIGPRWAREGLKITQDGPKKGSRSPKMSPRSPKMAKHRSHIAEDGLYVRWTRILRVRTRRKSRNYCILRGGARSNSRHYRSDRRNYRILSVRTRQKSRHDRKAETIVFCGSEMHGRAESTVFCEVEADLGVP